MASKWDGLVIIIFFVALGTIITVISMAVFIFCCKKRNVKRRKIGVAIPEPTRNDSDRNLVSTTLQRNRPSTPRLKILDFLPPMNGVRPSDRKNSTIQFIPVKTSWQSNDLETLEVRPKKPLPTPSPRLPQLFDEPDVDSPRTPHFRSVRTGWTVESEL